MKRIGTITASGTNPALHEAGWIDDTMETMEMEGEKRMCLDCGCGKPNESHGDNRHITLDQLKSAAQASNIEVEEAADRIHAEAKKLKEQGTIS